MSRNILVKAIMHNFFVVGGSRFCGIIVSIDYRETCGLSSIWKHEMHRLRKGRRYMGLDPFLKI